MLGLSAVLDGAQVSMCVRSRAVSNSTWTSILVLGCLGAALLGCGPQEPASKRPNILIIVLDTFRADRLGQGLTPKMDALASASTVFERAVTSMASTMPAHASMFTGLAPVRHGVRWNGDELSSSHVTAAEVLRDSGYETAAFVSKTRLLTRSGFEQGFSTVSNRRFDDSAPMNHSGGEITEMARSWICGGPAQPFFAWVHYNDAHTPYRMNEFAAERLGDYNGILVDGADAPLLLKNREHITASPEELRVLREIYDGNVVELDRQVGRLIEACDGANLLEDTVIILTADHGQLLGEHGDLLHGGHLWDPALRIPLIIHHPAARTGRVVHERVGIADIAPTLIELAGQPVPAGLQGRSLVAALSGAPIEDRVYVSEVKREGDANDAPIGPADLALYDGELKVIRQAGAARVYDISRDAGETSALRNDRGQALITRADILMGAYSQTDSGKASKKREELDAATLEELRMLGYIE